MSTADAYQWLAVVTPPPTEDQGWRALVVRLGPHADGRAGHHWWPAKPSGSSEPAGMRRFEDEEGSTGAIELTAPSLEDIYARVQAARLDVMAFGSPALLLVQAEGIPSSGGWVWPLARVRDGFPFQQSV